MTAPTANSSSKTAALVLQNQPAELSHLADWVAALARDLDLTPRLAFRLELALTEAVTNVIEHGLTPAYAGTIAVTARQTPTALILTVADGGPPFDPLQTPVHVAPDSLDEAGIGGLGVHLLRRYADDCAYTYRDDRNELTLIYQLAQETDA